MISCHQRASLSLFHRRRPVCSGLQSKYVSLCQVLPLNLTSRQGGELGGQPAPFDSITVLYQHNGTSVYTAIGTFSAADPSDMVRRSVTLSHAE